MAMLLVAALCLDMIRGSVNVEGRGIVMDLKEHDVVRVIFDTAILNSRHPGSFVDAAAFSFAASTNLSSWSGAISGF